MTVFALFLVVLAFLLGGVVIYVLALWVPDFVAKPKRYLTRLETKLQRQADEAVGKGRKVIDGALKDVQDLIKKIDAIK